MNQQNLFDQYPNRSGFKKPGTSKDAADSMEPRAKTLRDKIMRVLRRGPKTPDEVAAYLGENILGVRPRFSELFRKGLIVETGLRRKNSSGKFATVWRIKNI